MWENSNQNMTAELYICILNCTNTMHHSQTPASVWKGRKVISERKRWWIRTVGTRAKGGLHLSSEYGQVQDAKGITTDKQALAATR